MAVTENTSYGERLEDLTVKAFDKIDEILTMAPLDGAAALKLLSIQKDAAQTVLSTTVKVQEAQFRAEATDRLGSLLARVLAAEAEDAGLVIDHRPAAALPPPRQKPRPVATAKAPPVVEEKPVEARPRPVAKAQPKLVEPPQPVAAAKAPQVVDIFGTPLTTPAKVEAPRPKKSMCTYLSGGKRRT